MTEAPTRNYLASKMKNKKQIVTDKKYVLKT